MGISLLFGAEIASAEAQLTPQTPWIDMGAIPVGQPTTFYVDFENTGDQPLVIEHARGSVHDMKIQHYEQVIFPGSYSTIEGTVLVRGPFSKKAYVTLYTSIGTLTYPVHWRGQ